MCVTAHDGGVTTFETELDTLKKALAQASVSIDEVLERAGVDRSTWTRWNNGSVTSPRFDSWAKVKDASAHLLKRKKGRVA
jgi:hypothetical protein